MAHKNKRRGNRWERDGVAWWATLFNLVKFTTGKGKEPFDISTTRHMSKGMDDKGIDIWFNPGTVKPFLQRVKDQRKEQQSNGKATSIKLDALFDMQIEQGDLPMLFTRITHKTEKGRAIIDHEVVTMKVTDFEEIINDWYLFNLLREIHEDDIVERSSYINDILNYQND